jgi:hypothetical protein
VKVRSRGSRYSEVARRTTSEERVVRLGPGMAPPSAVPTKAWRSRGRALRVESFIVTVVSWWYMS